jgi:hypothetical protein
MAQQVKGQVETALGEAQDAVEAVIGNNELHLDGHVTLGLKNSSARVAFTRSNEPVLAAREPVKK